MIHIQSTHTSADGVQAVLRGITKKHEQRKAATLAAKHAWFVARGSAVSSYATFDQWKELEETRTAKRYAGTAYGRFSLGLP